MKKILPGCALALALLLGGCAGEAANTMPPMEAAPYSAADAGALIDAGAFQGEMEEVDAYVVSMLYGIDEESIKECASYMALDTSVSADEVTALVMADEESAQAAVTACQERVEDQIGQCRDYCPDQVPKLEDAVILRRGSTVLFAVGDPDGLPQALGELGLD